MTGLWKEELSGWNNKDHRRKKQTRKNTLRDKSRAILQDFYKDRNNFTRTENAQTLTFSGSRWGGLYHFPEFADICKIQIKIPKKGDEFDSTKGSYTTLKAYYKGTKYNGAWLELESGINIREYLNLGTVQRLLIRDEDIYIIEKVGLKRLDWSAELEARKVTKTIDFTHRTSREFVYNKPMLEYLKWSMSTESSRRKFAHKYVQGQTRASVRNWIAKGDWDAERQIPWGEISYAWIVD